MSMAIRILFRTQRPVLFADRIQEKCLLWYPLTRLDHFYLPRGLILNCVFDVAKRVQVFDLGPDAIFRRAALAHRYVAIASEASFLHLAVGRIYVSKYRVQLAQISAGIFCGAEIRFADDLD